MKIRIDVDLSPAEARAFFGLPDVGPMQEELLKTLRERMRAGVEGFDALSLMQPFLTWNLQSLEAMRKAFSASVSRRDDDDSA